MILSALRRVVGARQAERVALAGLLMSLVDAAAMGLVDEVVPAERVVDRALTWCHDLHALPGAAMELTRKQARADLVREFARDIDSEPAEMSSWWWSEETQAALHRMATAKKQNEQIHSFRTRRQRALNKNGFSANRTCDRG